MGLGIYIHIPFCASKCAYCDFYSLPRAGAEAMDAYVRALTAHLDAFAPRRLAAETVYFGGGTPTVLGERRLLAIWDAVVRNFRVSRDAEVTLEANPESVGPWLGSLRRAGFGRLSLGMQSARDGELRALGRVHTAARVPAAVETARAAGFGNLSLDLMYGLPGQTLAGWEESVRAAVSLAPEHLSCYGLKAEPGTPLYARRDALPDPDAQAAQYLRAVEVLSAAGYGLYEISNFAKPGYESRHNLRYWTLGAYLGFGPGAHSDFGGVRFAFARDLDAYVRAAEKLRAGVQTGTDLDAAFPGFPLSERTEISPRERTREWVMLGLRTARGLDMAEYAARFGGDPAPLRPFLDRCAAAGYGAWDGGRFALTPAGFLVSNAIILEALDRIDQTAPMPPMK